MAEPMKIRAQLKGDIAEIRVLMPHPMETGQRKESDGKIVPAHFIQTIGVALNGKTVVTAQTGAALRRNPLFGFKLRGAKIGDKVTIVWHDNRGDSRSDEAIIA